MKQNIKHVSCWQMFYMLIYNIIGVILNKIEVEQIGRQPNKEM